MMTDLEQKQLDHYKELGLYHMPSGETVISPGQIVRKTKEQSKDSPESMEDIYTFLYQMEQKYPGQYVQAVLFVYCKGCNHQFLTEGIFDTKRCPSCGLAPTTIELADSIVVYKIVDSE